MKAHILISIILLAPLFLLGENASEQLRKSESKITIQTDTEIIGGTLAYKKDANILPLVIMISGSGPQDRDCDIYGFKIFGTLADHLIDQGIPSFRYDDRGVGKSTGDFANSTIDDLAEDVEEIMGCLQRMGYREFILLGHSQGGIIAGKVAARNPSVKGVILMASTGVPLIDIVLAQVRREMIQAGVDRNLVESEVNAHKLLIKAITEGTNEVEARQIFEKTIFQTRLANEEGNEKNLKRKAKELTKEYEVVYGLPSLASFLFYDPTEDLKQLNVPVLAFFGENDKQVSIEQNKDQIDAALLKAKVEYEWAVFDKANHLFQESETGMWNEYKSLDKNFADGFSDKMAQWIHEHFNANE